MLEKAKEGKTGEMKRMWNGNNLPLIQRFRVKGNALKSYYYPSL